MYLETNERTVVLHHLFPDVPSVPDKELVPIVEATCPAGLDSFETSIDVDGGPMGAYAVPQDEDDTPRSWYYAMLDYVAYLKKTVPNPSRRAKSYTRQSQIVEAVQGPLVMNDCTADEGMCPRMECCCYHPIWAGAQELLRDYLDSVTLDEVVNHRQYPAVDVKFTDRDRFVEDASGGQVGGTSAARPAGARLGEAPCRAGGDSFETALDVAGGPMGASAVPQDEDDTPRSWYYAMLDYGQYLKKTVPNPSRRAKAYTRQSKFEGSYLKKTVPNPSRRAKAYTRQSKFEGSRRQKRAEIVRMLLAAG